MMERPLCPKVPPHVTAIETIGGRTTYHAFRTIAQRDDWMDQDPVRRSSIGHNAPAIIRAWISFEIILHPDTTVRKVLR